MNYGEIFDDLLIIPFILGVFCFWIDLCCAGVLCFSNLSTYFSWATGLRDLYSIGTKV